jgi:predicted ATP-dependent protease
VDNSETEGAPVVYEDHPYYHNLVGRIEYQSSLGAFVTNFAMIKPGSLHRANGGYLVVHARDLLLQPFAWEAMKRCLRSGEVRMQSLGAEMNLISTVSLQPEPISLDVKVVLLGDRLLYYLLQAYDPDFDELFKVEADFNDDMDRSKESCRLYARMLATLGKAESSRPMNAEAVAAMIEEAARQVGDQEKLSTHIRSCADLYRESDYWASTDNGSEVIEARHVHKAIDEQVYRSDRIRELIREQIRRGTLMVDVDGKRIGQVNGLSVMQIGHLAFGRPSRITATVRLGRGKVVDIEREVELGGPTHSKGVMILSSVLASRYAKDCPLSLSASLVFEQSYGSVDGDSASMAELCALLSALAELPIRQDLAITGSLNQLAEAQPIGGATEKIEGFFDICSAKGLTGDQGVLIPASNAKHLMLRQEVVEAVDQGKFHVFTYKNVDEAISILTGVEAGERATADGKYPADTVNFLVDKRLHEMSDLIRNYTESLEKNEK